VVAKKKLRSSFSNRKNVAEKKPTKALAPTGFFRSLAALAAYFYNPVRRSTTVHYIPYFIPLYIKIIFGEVLKPFFR
jgi:hypothetical protein